MGRTAKIHLVWLGSVVPARVRAVALQLQDLNPGAVVQVWTDADLSWLTNYAELLAEPRMSGKANIARYEILLRHGGIYLDADFCIHRSLGQIFAAIERFGLVAARQSRVLFNPAFIAAQAGHAAMERAVTGIAASRERFADSSSPVRTGPHYFTSILLDHVRSGGTFGELPHHAVFPWYADEAPLERRAIPEAVIVSHEWAAMQGATYWESGAEQTESPSSARVQAQHGRPTVRGRLSSNPVIHEAIRRVEDRLYRRDGRTRLLAAGQPSRDDRAMSSGLATPRVNPTTAALDAWTARQIARSLRGSDGFLDVIPGSFGAFSTALRALDRPGRAILVTSSDGHPPGAWHDRSIRCSAHVLTVSNEDSDRILRLESNGSALVAREVSIDQGLLGYESPVGDATLAELIGRIPRFALVRCAAEAMTQPLSDTFSQMMASSRIARLLLTVDPASVVPGTSIAIDFVRRQAHSGRDVSIGPWVVDGRKRDWDEHLRIAARPFIVSIR